MRLRVKTSLSKLGGKSLKNDGSKKKKKIDDSKRYAGFLSFIFLYFETHGFFPLLFCTLRNSFNERNVLL